MTDAFLALIPNYGVWVIFVSVMLSGLGLPIPSSLMVMVAGGFAAAGDFTLIQLFLVALAGFVLGDQVSYGSARYMGASVVGRFESHPNTSALISKARTLVERRGLAAVFLSRSVASPIGPYVGYLSGALGLNWLAFTITALSGALVWCLFYVVVGYAFADQIMQVAMLISHSAGLLLCAAAIFGALIYVVRVNKGISAWK